ncbi:hypothetical protein [Ralstonia insidiosa]|mgnify:FL=1|jgi:hypothetical protein|nr:hypothetical protein [Ralstonia insidiosa]MBA9940870.1 hypothetical protein [Ralstonia insidiosa]MBC9969076.1 hypothetical protein [Ralstonia insidiosa]MBX3905303.1 hypothetical protein [Ralstonia insidiosa]
MNRIALPTVADYKRLYRQEKAELHAEDKWADTAWLYDFCVLAWKGLVYAIVLVPVAAFWVGASDLPYVRELLNQGNFEDLKDLLLRYFAGFYFLSFFGHALFYRWTLPARVKRRIAAKVVAQYIKDDIRSGR